MTADGIQALTNFAARAGENATFRAMIEAVPIAIYTTDARGALTYFNAAAVELSGRVPTIGTDHWCVTWKLFLPDGTPLRHDQCPMATALKGGEVANGGEYIAERPDGTRFWFSPFPAVLRDIGGKIIGAVNVLVDITNSKKAEIEADEGFRAIVETTPECVTIIAPDGTLLFMNSSGLHILDLPQADAVIGKSIYDIIAQEDRGRFREFNERICGGEKGTLAFDVITLQGARRQMEAHAACLRHADGTIVQLAIIREISDRKQAERTGLLLSAIVDSSDDAIISKNLNGIITSWNKGAEHLFGYTATETIGKPITILIPTERLQEEPDILARLRRGERVDHFETVRRRKDGSLIDISLTISPVKDENGTIVGASKIARDITQRRLAEAAQKHIEEDLRRANQDLEQFAFSASHDLQEPLRGIKIYSELLLDCFHSNNEECKEYLAHVRNGATRMQVLLSDLLAYTQVTKFETPTKAADAGGALATAIANLDTAVSETGAQITADPLPSLHVHELHLQQLFQNLIGNALKYSSPDRPPIVHVTAEPHDFQWIVSVRDNGIGIDPQYKENIFGLFKRLHTSDKYSGTGIGLALCRRIVDRYHGRIWVESEPGRGSTFRFTLPG